MCYIFGFNCGIADIKIKKSFMHVPEKDLSTKKEAVDCGYTAQETIFSFSGRPEKIVFPKNCAGT